MSKELIKNDDEAYAEENSRFMTKKMINVFMAEIKEQYPDLNIFVDYDEEINEYDIWHTDAKLQFGDSNFLKFVGGLMQEYFFSNGIYNFSFGYDHMKAKEELKCKSI